MICFKVAVIVLSCDVYPTLYHRQKYNVCYISETHKKTFWGFYKQIMSCVNVIKYNHTGFQLMSLGSGHIALKLDSSET